MGDCNDCFLNSHLFFEANNIASSKSPTRIVFTLYYLFEIWCCSSNFSFLTHTCVGCPTRHTNILPSNQMASNFLSIFLSRRKCGEGNSPLRRSPKRQNVNCSPGNRSRMIFLGGTSGDSPTFSYDPSIRHDIDDANFSATSLENVDGSMALTVLEPPQILSSKNSAAFPHSSIFQLSIDNGTLENHGILPPETEPQQCKDKDDKSQHSLTQQSSKSPIPLPSQECCRLHVRN